MRDTELQHQSRSWLLGCKRLTNPGVSDLRVLMVHVAVETSDVRLLRVLCDAGVDINIKLQDTSVCALLTSCTW